MWKPLWCLTVSNPFSFLAMPSVETTAIHARLTTVSTCHLICQARYLTNSMVDPVVDLTCMMLTLDPPWPPNLSNSAYVCMPINSISFTRDFSLAPYMPDSSMTNYTFLFIMETTICVAILNFLLV